ncbi:lamin-like protein [Prunus persica]|nr:lamin-like protein [Prunus persica]
MTVAMVITLRAEMGNASGKMHSVGGSKTSWGPSNVNLTEWSSHETFYVGDWLYFGYDKYQYNVLEVNKTSYEKCIDKDFIKNITGGAGRDVFNLTQTKTYYFLSSGGYCFQGLKVAVNVLRPLPPAPAPTSTSTTTTFSSSLLLLLLLLFIII